MNQVSNDERKHPINYRLTPYSDKTINC
jgi:hypothetical protein